MPIEINGQPFVLKNKDIAQLKAHYGLRENERGVIRLKYDKQHLRKSESKDSNTIIKPRSFSLSPKEVNVPLTVGNNNLNAEVLYYESRRPHPDLKGEYMYEPAFITVDHNQIIYNDVGLDGDRMANGELLWFLHNACKQCVSGQNFSPDSSARIYIDNPRKEADEKARIKRENLKIQKLLYDEKDGLNLSNLKLAAKVLMLTVFDDTPSVLQAAIEDALNHPSRGAQNRREFLDFVDNGRGENVIQLQTKIKVMVMEAIEQNVIQYSPNTAEYLWSLANGQPGGRICIVRNTLDSEARVIELVEHMSINDSDRKILERTFPDIEQDIMDSVGGDGEETTPVKSKASR